MQNKKWDFRILSAHGLTIILWGTAFPVIRFGLEAFSPEHLTLLRLLIASFVLLIFAVINKMRLPELKDIPAIFILGGLGFTVYHLALNCGEKSVAAGPASLIISVTPIFTAILALIFFGEKLRLSGWIGGVISMIGVAFLSLGGGDLLQLNSGVLFILLAAFSESLFFVFQKSYLKKYGFLAFTTYTIWAGTLFMLIFLQGIHQEIIKAPIEATLSAVYLGLFPTVLPYIALAYITSHSGASEATSSLYLTPVIAGFVAWIWLGEIPTFMAIIGGGITMLGVLITHIKSINNREERTEKIQSL